MTPQEPLRVPHPYQERDEIVREVQRISKIGVWDWDLVQDRMRWSPEQYELLGIDPVKHPDPKGLFYQALHPEDRDRLHESIANSILHNSSLDESCRVIRTDGELRYLRCCGEIHRDDSGLPIRFLGTLTDLTAWYQLHHKLSAAEERWKFALEGGDEGVWDWNIATGEVFLSDRWKSILGYLPHEIGNSYETWASQLHPDDLPQAEETLRRYLAGESGAYQTEHRIRCKDGSYKWVLDRGMVVARDAAGAPLRMVGTHADIDARKRAEERLLAAEERWKFALEGGGEGVWDWDLSTGEAFFSDRWKLMLGYLPGELTASGEVWLALIHPEDRANAEQEFQRHVRGEAPEFRAESRMRCKSGQYKWIEARGKVVSYQNGRPHRVVGTQTDIDERKRAVQELRRDEERWKFALEGSGNGVWDWNIATGEVFLSDRWKTSLGYQPHEIGNNYLEWSSRVHPDDLAQVEDALQRYLAGETPSYRHEYRIRDKQGAYRWVRGSGIIAARGPDGQALRMVGTNEEIDERKRAEQALQRSEERWKFALEGNGNGVWDWDLTTNEVFFSDRWKLSLGYQPHELRGWLEEWSSRVHPDDLPQVTATQQRCIDGEFSSYVHEYRLRDQQGRYRWVCGRGMVVTRGPDGRPLRLVGTKEDIDARKRAEQALHESEARFRQAFASSGVGIALVSIDGHFLQVNKVLCQIFGYSEEELLQLTFQAITKPEDLAHDLASIERLLRGEEDRYQIEKRYLHKSGRVVWARLNVALVRSEDRSPLYFVSQVDDITARHTAEEQLRASLSEKEVLLQEVHHRVKNNVQVISSMLRLQAGRVSDPAVAQALDDMQGRVHSIALLHEKLYQSSDLAHIQMDAYLQDLAHTVLRTQDASGIRVEIEPAGCFLPLETAVPCGLIVNELLTNATKHAFPSRGGKLCQIWLSLGCREGTFGLCVRDNGVGLSPQVDLRTTESLGLHLVRTLTRQLRGTLSLSRDGGTSFLLSFPAPGLARQGPKDAA